MEKLIRMICATCGSEDVLADSYSSWDVAGQCWTHATEFDAKICEDCDGETSLTEVEITDPEEVYKIMAEQYRRRLEPHAFAMLVTLEETLSDLRDLQDMSVGRAYTIRGMTKKVEDQIAAIRSKQPVSDDAAPPPAPIPPAEKTDTGTS